MLPGILVVVTLNNAVGMDYSREEISQVTTIKSADEKGNVSIKEPNKAVEISCWF